MAKYSNKNCDDLDITKAELKDFEEALKKDEFRKMFCDYVEEVTDPKNRAIYEEEMTQLEKERGVDITFMHPNPGYVIKTSVDGEQKAFINVCSNDKIGKPVAVKKVQNGVSGSDWSIPYILAPPKVDLDKKSQRCVVYDVLFHPLTLQIAKTNKEFRNLVNDTAISGVEDSFNAKLDRNNIKFPKMDFKGHKMASVVRKLRKDKPLNSGDEPLNIPNYPFKLPSEDKKPTVTKPRKCNYGGSQNQIYTTPKYIIKQRKGIEYCEFLDTMDSKINAAIPSELVIEIELPLLSSTGDAILDVSTRRLTLSSESPAKYKLDIKLPYDVDESNGSAKFDKRTKKLLVTLPVVKKALDLSYLSRDDSGIESDQNQNRSSSDEDLSRPAIEVLSSCDRPLESEYSSNCLRTSAQVCDEFLSSHLHYSFPLSTVFNNGNSITVTINVKNIDPSTVSNQYVLQGSGVHFKFTSLGSGHFPIHYTYCIQFPPFSICSSSLKVEVWDNNLIINMDLKSEAGAVVSSYYVGPHTMSLEKRDLIPTKVVLDNHTKKFEDIEEEIEEKELKHEKNIVVTAERISSCLNESSDPRKTLAKIENNHKEENTDSSEDICQKISSIELAPSSCQINKKQIKVRTASESNAHPPCLAAFSRRSILKTSRSLSESNTDEYNTWSSLDSSDANEDANGTVVKKTVRFSDVISKKVFRANSSILGQKHKNEKKSRNRKKMARRRIESDTSEVSDFSDYSEMSEVSASETSEASDASSDDQSGGSSAPPQLSCSKRHRRRGSKNSRKNAATAKQNCFLLSHE